MNWNRDVAARGLARALRMLMLVAAAWAGAAAAETYVILSLIGDHLTVITEERQTGSRLDRNRQEVVPLPEPALDDFAARVADAMIGKVRSDASVITLRARDPTLYALRDSWLASDSVNVQALLSLVAKQLPASTDAHLLLITPYRDEPELKTDRASRGTGKVAGLGFYVESSTRIRRSDTLETGRGFLGVFAHFQLVLINLQSNAIEAHERVVLGTTYSAARAEDRTVWNALTQEQKARALESLMKRGIESSLPGMLSSQKR